MSDLRCDVCGKSALGVASSGYGPISNAYCGECVDRHAEPLSGFEYLYDFVSTDGEGLADYVQSYQTFIDGRYVTWPEYVAERRKGPVCEVHKVHVLERGCDLCAYDKWSAEPASGIETEGRDNEDWHSAEHESPTREAGDAHA